jgi:hypothetical protein
MRRARRGWHLIGWCGVVTATLIFSGSSRGQEPKPVESISPELDGAWRRTFSETIGPDGTRYPGSIHESFLLISDGFYSMNWAFGPEPSDYYSERFRPTDDEKLARYGVLLVNAGRFELDGNVLTIHPTFAVVPEFIGGLGEFEYSLDGDTLHLVWRRIVSADGVPDPNTAAGVRYVSRWERIQRQVDFP